MVPVATEAGRALGADLSGVHQRGRPRLPAELLFAFRSVVDIVRRTVPGPDDVVVPYTAKTIEGTVTAVEGMLLGQLEVQPPEGAETRRFVRAVRQELMLSWHVRSAMIPAQDLRRLMDILDAVSDASQESGSPSAAAVQPALLDSENLLAAVHDLRSPLTSILLLVESLKSRNAGPVTDIQLRQLNLIYDAALGLNITSSNLVEALRADGPASMANRLSPFSVAEVLYGVRDILRPVAEERGVELVLTLPQADARIGNPTLLSRILLNLTSNALRETREGRVEILVREYEGGVICYQVRDTGPGMDPAVFGQASFPVQRPHAQPRDWLASAGIGLAICRRMAEVMGGELSVESTPGVGTTVSFRVEQPPVQ